ncbi:MAG: hypothetical protein H8D56_17840 [Planctomycetes bacterium]|nr:hypothetical protein [Planctomycetota bacterium]MBL7146793.1 hypothetical protein [Phycisphaerae bacterium]
MEQIKQIIPASGWYAAFEQEGGKLSFCELAVWALTEEGEIVGIAPTEYGGEIVSEAENFRGYYTSEHRRVVLAFSGGRGNTPASAPPTRWMAEYSLSQDAFNVDTFINALSANVQMVSEKRNNDYLIFGLFKTQDEAHAACDKMRGIQERNQLSPTPSAIPSATGSVIPSATPSVITSTSSKAKFKAKSKTKSRKSPVFGQSEG